MRILIAGSQGQLARALVELAPRAADVQAFAAGRPALDLTSAASVLRTLGDFKPDIIINAAAYTAVDKAESEPEAAMALNCTGPQRLAEEAARIGAAIIHVSTDYVFDGTKSAPYVETDPTGPVSSYGRSKLAGELAVAAACPRHVILRTAWVHSPFGANFVKTMLRLAGERPELRVVDDQIGCPTYAPHLAAAILELARQLPQAASAPEWGVYHAAGRGAVTWCGFAREIVRQSARHGGPSVPVAGIATADYPTPARRPANSRLDSGKLERTFGIALPTWEQGAEECVSRLLAPA